MNTEELNLIISQTRDSGTVGAEFFKKLSECESIVLRGAGSFGSEIGRRLIDNGVSVDKLLYWDVRADNVTNLHGIPVVQPFSGNASKLETIIIHCIPNGSLSGSSIRTELLEHGFTNIIEGMPLFEAAFCEMDSNKGYDAKVCLNTTVCNWDSCGRLMHFMNSECESAPEDELLSFQVIAFVLSLKCTLSCTHCGEFINSYAKQNKDHHLPFDELKHDIDRFFDAVDTVGFVSVIGGEAFLHPEFDRIISLILEKKNFGVMGITTNGICKITEKHLSVLKNDRTRVIFSDYTKVLSKQQKKLFDDNVKKVRDYGIHYTVGEPVWVEPPSLRKQDFSEVVMTDMKQGCSSTITCQTIQNGKLYPCGVTPNVFELDVADYPSDYVSLDSVELRQDIKDLHARSFYHSCNHCAEGGGHLTHSGEQGYDSRYDHLLDGISIVDAR